LQKHEPSAYRTKRKCSSVYELLRRKWERGKLDRRSKRYPSLFIHGKYKRRMGTEQQGASKVKRALEREKTKDKNKN